MIGDICLVIHWYDWTYCAIGNKGLAGLISNPVLANGVAGLATSATAQATIERFVLWTLRDSVSFHRSTLVRQPTSLRAMYCNWSWTIHDLLASYLAPYT